MKNLLFILSIILIFTACSEDSSAPKDGPNPDSSENVFFFTKIDMDSEDWDSDIAKYDMNTGQDEIIINSSRLMSAPAKGKMVFEKDSVIGSDEDEVTGTSSIIVSDLDGSNQKVIESINYEDSDYGISDPILTNNADRVIYTRYYFADDDNEEELWISDLNGENKSMVYNNSRADFSTLSFSNDGSKIAFNDYNDYLIVIDINSKQIITDIGGFNRGNDLNLPIIWTNDDSKLIFHSRSQDDKFEFTLINSDGTNMQKISNEKDIIFASLSPDNSKLTFAQLDNETEEISILESDIDGNNQEILLAAQPGENYFLAQYCPDGKTMLIYMSREGLNIDGMTLGKLDIETKQLTTILNYPTRICFFGR